MSYTSSIIQKYGDVDRVKADALTIRRILERQGSSLVIDVIAEKTAEIANAFKLDYLDRSNTRMSLVDELNEALMERL